LPSPNQARFTHSGRLATGTLQVSSSRSGESCTKRGTFAARFTGQRHLAVGTCSPPHTRTLADDRVSRVYRERYVYDPVVRNFDGGYDNGTVLYACQRRAGRRWFLAGDDTSKGPEGGLQAYYGWAEEGGRVTLSGQFVAIGVFDACVFGFASGVRIVDLHSGNVEFEEDATAGDFDHLAEVKALALSPSGSADWIVCEGFGQHHCQVVDEVAFGPSTELDRSDKIDSKSLTLDGSTLSWRNNGETKTATLA
jgi:hypothetical protein